MQEFSSLGKIRTMQMNPKGYLALIIDVNTPYKSSWKKFNVWNQMCNGFSEGDHVCFTYSCEKYPTLKSIQAACLGSCQICQSYYIEEDAQKDSCGFCNTVQQLERVNKSLKLISNKIKEYEYSKGCSMAFAENETGYLFNSCVFENNPLFDTVKELEVGLPFKVLGWKTKTYENGNSFFNLCEISRD